MLPYYNNLIRILLKRKKLILKVWYIVKSFDTNINSQDFCSVVNLKISISSNSNNQHVEKQGQSTNKKRGYVIALSQSSRLITSIHLNELFFKTESLFVKSETDKMSETVVRANIFVFLTIDQIHSVFNLWLN